MQLIRRQLVTFLFLSFMAQAVPLRVLVLDGRNNHDWARTSQALVASLEATGRFEVEVSTAPVQAFHRGPRAPKTEDPDLLAAYAEAQKRYKAAESLYRDSQVAAWDAWQPDFASYDAVLLNYNGPDWPDDVRKDFEAYIRNGGGVVLVHAANNAFRNWEAFNRMIGLGWRPADMGTCLTIDDANGAELRDTGCGSSSHGSKHPFQVTVRAPEHPVMKGLPGKWMHGRDELYHRMRGPALNLTVLSSAFSDPAQRGSGKHEPLTWEVRYGKGRVIVTSMGHFWVGDDQYDSLHCVGFQTVIARSMEYVGSGKVTVPVPDTFPSADAVSVVAPEFVGWGGATNQVDDGSSWKAKKDANLFAYLSGVEARAAMVVEEGFDVQLVAESPQVEEPTVAAFDGNGALYVAEMRSYMQDVLGTGTKTLKNGQIRKLQDLDGDGVFETDTIFASGLNLPRMILPLDDRLAVTETDSTDVWSYRDTDGDGVADEKVLLSEGTRKIDVSRSVEHQDAGLMWNIDNWIYNTRGRLRYRFTNGTWEEEAIEFTWQQWGMTHDDLGRVYYSANSYPGSNFQMGQQHYNLIKKRAKGKWTAPSIGPNYQPEFMTMHSICPVGDRGEDKAYSSFTSACGQSIYRGESWPREFYGDYFVCDPTGHVVRRAKVINKNGRRELVNARPGKEFIVSPDIYFRPVNTLTGPDGCLYIIDMARGIVQDAPWVNEGAGAFMKKVGLDKHAHKGRIWRVTHERMEPGPVQPRMLDESTAQLLRHLQHHNGWWRDMAQQLIILRDDRDSVASLLADMVHFDQNHMARFHALWTLEGMDKLTPALLVRGLTDHDARVRHAAAQQAKPWVMANDELVLTALEKLAGNERDPEVVRQAILSLGWSDEARAVQIIETMIKRHLINEGVYLSAMTALYQRKTPLIEGMLDGSAFKDISDARQRINAQRQWQQGIRAWTEEVAPTAPVSEEVVALIEQGEEAYRGLCIACHGPDGKGIQIPGSEMALSPSLVGSPRVLGQKEVVNRILLHGLTGPIDGKDYVGGLMAPMGDQSDEWIAAVLTYIRQAWGNHGSAILPAEVALTRQIVGEQSQPWTQDQLAAFDLPELTNQLDWGVDSSAGSESARRAILRKGSCDNPNKPGRWYQIDFTVPTTLTRLIFTTSYAERYPRGWELRISHDGTSWSDPIAAGEGTPVTEMTFEPLKTRFVKVIQTGESKHHRWSISQIRAFGVSAAE